MNSYHNYRLIFKNNSNLEISIIFPIYRTIGELKNFIFDKLRTRNMEGDIYYLFNPNQIELNEEGLLGGILFPESTIISDSILENNSIFCIDEQDNFSNEDNEEIEEEINYAPPNSFVSIVNFYNSRLNNLMDLTNQVNDNEINFENYENRSLFDYFLNTINPINANNNQLNSMNLFYIASMVPSNMNNFEDVKVGLHKDDLESLKLEKYKSFFKEAKEKCENCSVCLEKFEEEDLVRELKCEHLFHKECIEHWLEDNIKCPLCRKETGRGVPKL